MNTTIVSYLWAFQRCFTGQISRQNIKLEGPSVWSWMTVFIFRQYRSGVPKWYWLIVSTSPELHIFWLKIKVIQGDFRMSKRFPIWCPTARNLNWPSRNTKKYRLGGQTWSVVPRSKWIQTMDGEEIASSYLHHLHRCSVPLGCLRVCWLYIYRYF